MNDGTAPTPPPPQASCHACRSPLSEGATVCPVCKSYQSKWKSRLQYFGTVGGVVTIIISLLTYVAATLPQIKKNLIWKDSVEIIAFLSTSEVVIQNSSDGEVFVSHIFLSSDRPPVHYVISINKPVKERAFLVHEIESEMKAQKEWQTGGPTLDALWEMMLDVPPGFDECYTWVFYHIDDPRLQSMKIILEERLNAVRINGSVVFYSGLDGRRIVLPVSVAAVPMQRLVEKCKGRVPGRPTPR